ncbi:alpha/beta fold hydrolase [Actinoplanes sp. DH11]|uniref:alpha/beta fold hydrolase n=1 Tax=Actinoplanes sp. DH11 TaxID=2857011 RepID=UPI001E348162|nr:alpha/beta hydrolase [Actinoplanes sp. DH11]
MSATILILHPGMSDETSWRRVADRLRPRFAVILRCRRRYRMDLDPPAGIGAEVADTIALAGDARPVLVGHSSGGVVALEALLAAPDAFAGAVLYEPPVVTGLPLGGAVAGQARDALDDGRYRHAAHLFLRDIVRIPRTAAWVSSVLIAAVPGWRRFVPRQIDDTLAIDALGDRRARYAAVRRPVLLLGGDRSPGHLGERLDALAAVLPHAERVTLRGRGHGANTSAPDQVAAVVAGFAARIEP